MSNVSQFIRLNTVLQLPPEVVEEVIIISREIATKHRVYFTLDGIQFFPHVTIHLPEYPRSNTEKIVQKVEEIAHITHPIELRYLRVMTVDGYVGVEFERSAEIMKLHAQVVEKLNSLREGHLRTKYQSGNDQPMNFTPAQRENIKKFGAPDVMEFYRPHLTIIRLHSNPVAEKIARNLRWRIPAFTVDAVAVYTMGEHGTCKELIGEFSLK